MGVAVVELFTSEGCSSCPPAEALVAKISAEAQPGVFPLAFHVDYWDQGGWKDAFSDPRFSARQEAYAKAGTARGVYTPQMFVNGGAGFVGSDAEQARSEIAAALAKPAPVEVRLRVTGESSGGRLVVGYDLGAGAAGKTLNVALAERGIERRIANGENAGKVLRHENVARAFESIRVADLTGKVELAVPADAVVGHCTVVAYVQDERFRVTGAVRVALADKVR